MGTWVRPTAGDNVLDRDVVKFLYKPFNYVVSVLCLLSSLFFRHVKRLHKDKKIFQCDVCHKGVNLIRQLRRHKYRKHGIPHETLQVCNFKLGQ